MHPKPQPYACDDGLICRLVAFKWLMIGEGMHVDVPRLRKDEDYARGCLRCGLNSHSAIVRKESRGLQQVLTPLPVPG